MAATVTFTQETLFAGAVRAIGSTLSVSDQDAQMLVDLGVATAPGLTPQIGSVAGALISGFAPLVSPALSGTPTAPTATAGTNTTQIATTAFVTAAVPAVATNAQALLQSSATTALSPATIPFAMSNGLTQRFDYINTTAVAGNGGVTTAFTGYREMFTNSTGALGRASYAAGSVGTVSVFSGLTSEAQINFSKKIWLSGRFVANLNATYVGDANGFASISVGGYVTNTTGPMAVKGIGLKKIGGAASVIQLVVHNGTTETVVNTTKTMGTLEVVEYLIYSDGAGNVQLYLNGSLAASSSAGPTGATANHQTAYREQVEQTASATVRNAMHCFGGQILIER